MFNKLYRKISSATSNQGVLEHTLSKQTKNKSNTIAYSVVDKRTNFFFALVLIIPALIVLCTFTITPFILNVIYAFNEKNKINSSYTYKGFEYFNVVFEDLRFAVAVRNSFIFGLIVLPITMCVSLLISSLIASVIRKRARGFWQTVFFLPYVTNAVAIALAFVQIFDQNGQFNHILAGLGIKSDIPWVGDKATGNGVESFRPLLVMLINGVWNSLAFNVLIFTTSMLSVDKNLYRSASIDGCSGFKQFFTITLPSIKSTTTFIMTMGIINGIKVFPLALFNNKPDDAISSGASTLMLYIYKFAKGNQNIAGAASLILFIIGVSYSTIIRGGFKVLALASLNKGESNVWNKIKDSKEIRELYSKKEERFSYSASTW